MPDVKDRQHLLTLHKKAKKIGLDINHYNYLKDEVNTYIVYNYVTFSECQNMHASNIESVTVMLIIYF